MSIKNNTQNVWTLLTWLIIATLLLSGCGGTSKKVYRVGVIRGGAFGVIFDGFKAEMTKLGYIEGENIVYDVPDAGSDLAGAADFARQFAADKVDLIFVSGSTPGAIAAKAATEGTNIPVVFTYASTEGTGLIQTVREPGGNITGVRYPGHEMIIKRLEILRQIAPNAHRVWAGYDINNPNTASALESLRSGAEALELTLVEVPATKLDDFKADFEARAAADDPGIDALILMPDGLNMATEGLTLISQFAAEQKLPLAGSLLYTVEAGAVFGNANDLIKIGELAAPQADKILKGIPAGTIPVITPDQDLYINYKVAQEIGLTVPEGLLKMANQIVK
ncbi:MAG: ABC transporter substrate-binding protein [Anaerolineales bacterium]|nr:ABC transporter substrate-binding protein [Anaerolineales bacterium]